MSRRRKGRIAEMRRAREIVSRHNRAGIEDFSAHDRLEEVCEALGIAAQTQIVLHGEGDGRFSCHVRQHGSDVVRLCGLVSLRADDRYLLALLKSEDDRGDARVARVGRDYAVGMLGAARRRIERVGLALALRRLAETRGDVRAAGAAWRLAVLNAGGARSGLRRVAVVARR
jgi:hypothetical protein